MAKVFLRAPSCPLWLSLGSPANSPNAHSNGVPTVEVHLKLLTEKLALTADQQTKIKPILQELHDATLKAVQDESMSRGAHGPCEGQP
jgi:hypothetical protein